MNGNSHQAENFPPRINFLYINIDGASKSNPGESAISVVVRGEDKKILEEYSENIGQATGNHAEYVAASRALEIAAKYCRNEIKIFSDSKLLVNQLTGRYRIRDKKLFAMITQIKLLEHLFSRVRYFHIERENNYQANELANKVFQHGGTNNFSDKKWNTGQRQLE